MHARPEVARILIKKKLRHWLSIARYYPNRNPAQARRNYLRLLKKHPDVAAALNLSVTSCYE